MMLKPRPLGLFQKNAFMNHVVSTVIQLRMKVCSYKSSLFVSKADITVVRVRYYQIEHIILLLFCNWCTEKSLDWGKHR